MERNLSTASRKVRLPALITLMSALLWPAAGSAELVTLVTGLEGASGSTIGPGGALYVTEGAAGRLSRVDPQTGQVTTVASGFPQSIVGIGGAMDVVFVGTTAYVLVTLVGQELGGDPEDVVGIYRVDGPSDFTVIADIGTFAASNPPATSFFLATGVQYAIEHFRNGFLVTDGHHNRVLHVTLDGEISVFRAFENIVPTGLAIAGDTIYMAEAGPVPHLPEDGKVVSFTPRSADVEEVAAGGRLIVDVEFGRGRTLYALAQGFWQGTMDGEPALPNTGSLLQVNADGTFAVLEEEVNLPTSMQFIGNTAYIVSLAGDIFRVDDVSTPPFGRAR